ncbi:hypothetical protein HYPSUDRAFT_46675 [Hypholoma sublateritium FD-334 SS-4]|uniref:Protein kinase domain-containing protein n=1 Tax=Hypholoma sublateritium (strain FD-334 SS-4) TaxID=945553 RepID=A0A0D2PA89_HYPSF|nr:hypothetical protein HYPSUDRAFT_46675 [Hypholoma sublateritium FD-334 SS-4]
MLALSYSSLCFFQRLHFSLTWFFKFPARCELPLSLSSWKLLGHDEDSPSYIEHWSKLDAFFAHHGFTLWNRSDESNQSIGGPPPAPSNYVFVPSNQPNYVQTLNQFPVANGLLHAGRKDRRHYIIRVFTAGGEGLDTLNIIRLLTTHSPDNLLSNNHMLPMVEEIMYEDIVFGVFPLLGDRVQFAMMPFLRQSSVEDIVFMIMQALEAVIYIHDKNVGHRDLFMDNFLVEWAPESVLGKNWTRPRVYLIDFETAVHFHDDVDPSNRLVSGLPIPDSNRYQRARAPELLVSESHMYCPFRLDMWQFGFHLMQMFSKTGIAEIDTLWPPLMSENPTDRPMAREIFQKLGDFIAEVPPRALQKAYTCDPITVEVYGWP